MEAIKVVAQSVQQPHVFEWFETAPLVSEQQTTEAATPCTSKHIDLANSLVTQRRRHKTSAVNHTPRTTLKEASRAEQPFGAGVRLFFDRVESKVGLGNHLDRYLAACIKISEPHTLATPSRNRRGTE